MLSSDWYLREIPASNFFVKRAIDWGHDPDVVIRHFIANHNWQLPYSASNLCDCCGLPDQFCKIDNRACEFRLPYGELVNLCYWTNGGPWLTLSQEFSCQRIENKGKKRG